jgi:hypothetical protein
MEEKLKEIVLIFTIFEGWILLRVIYNIINKGS